MRISLGEMVVIFEDNSLNSMQHRRRSVQNNWIFGALAIQFQEVTTIDFVNRKKSFQADDVNGFLRAGGEVVSRESRWVPAESRVARPSCPAQAQ